MSGQKHDSDKILAGLVMGDFAHALEAVAVVGTFGAKKYSASNWLQVENSKQRYNDAMMRHWLKEEMGQSYDEESNLLHMAHTAWNALAVLEIELRNGAALLNKVPELINGYERPNPRTRTGDS